MIVVAKILRIIMIGFEKRGRDGEMERWKEV